MLKGGKNFLQFSDLSIELKKPLKAKGMIANDFVVIGSPATVRDKLEAVAHRLDVGHLMVVLQFGSMPRHVACKRADAPCSASKVSLECHGPRVNPK